MGGSQGPGGERPRHGGSANHAPTPTASHDSKRGPKETQCTETHTQRRRDRKSGTGRPGRRDQTKDARRRGERSRAAGAGVEPGWGYNWPAPPPGYARTAEWESEGSGEAGPPGPWGRGLDGRARAWPGRAWPRARELTSSVAAESTERGASGAGRQAGGPRSRSPRGPEPWRGGEPGSGLGGLSRPPTPSPEGRGPGSLEVPPQPAGPPLPSPSPQPEAPARGCGPRRSAEKQRDAAAAAAGPRGLRARPLLSPPRLPQGRRARGRDARLPGAAEARGARSDATRFPRALGDALSLWLGPVPVIGPCVCLGGLRGLGLDGGSILSRRGPSPIRPAGEGAIPPPGRRRTPPESQLGSLRPLRPSSKRPQHSGCGPAHSQAPTLGPTPPTRA